MMRTATAFIEDRRLTHNVIIETYRPELQAAFERLNREWLEAYGLIESHDVAVLQEPERYFLARGGEVFFARVADALVGSVAIVPESPQRFELAKLAVDPQWRGAGIGRKLANVALTFARDRAATSVVLSSNSALRDAIRLYESLGFTHVAPPADIKYETADVYMSLTL